MSLPTFLQVGAAPLRPSLPTYISYRGGALSRQLRPSCIHTCIHAYVHTHMHARMHACVHTCLQGRRALTSAQAEFVAVSGLIGTVTKRYVVVMRTRTQDGAVSSQGGTVSSQDGVGDAVDGERAEAEAEAKKREAVATGRAGGVAGGGAGGDAPRLDAALQELVGVTCECSPLTLSSKSSPRTPAPLHPCTPHPNMAGTRPGGA